MRAGGAASATAVWLAALVAGVGGPTGDQRGGERDQVVFAVSALSRSRCQPSEHNDPEGRGCDPSELAAEIADRAEQAAQPRCSLCWGRTWNPVPAYSLVTSRRRTCECRASTPNRCSCRRGVRLLLGLGEVGPHGELEGSKQPMLGFKADHSTGWSRTPRSGPRHHLALIFVALMIPAARPDVHTYQIAARAGAQARPGRRYDSL